MVCLIDAIDPDNIFVFWHRPKNVYFLFEILQNLSIDILNGYDFDGHWDLTADHVSLEDGGIGAFADDVVDVVAIVFYCFIAILHLQIILLK